MDDRELAGRLERIEQALQEVLSLLEPVEEEEPTVNFRKKGASEVNLDK